MSYRSYQSFKFTPVLTIIIINVVLFVGYLINSDLFLSVFGLSPAFFLREPWTILTSMFIHGGFWHIISNMLTLYFFGTALSGLVGDKKFLIVYFCGGILGSLFFIGLAYIGLTPLNDIGIGASGAIMALGGTLAVMRPRVKVYIIPIPVPIPLWIAVIGGFIILLPFPGIAWQAHLGGLIFGLIAGYFFRKRERRFYWR